MKTVNLASSKGTFTDFKSDVLRFKIGESTFG